MQRFSFVAAVLIVLLTSRAGRADSPATEFFAVETAKLAAIAPTDAALDAVTVAQFSRISLAQGKYGGGLSMVFTTPSFRIDARFDAAADPGSGGPALIGYRINAGTDLKSWNLVSVDGMAVRRGKFYITENWRLQPVAVILRFLDLKR